MTKTGSLGHRPKIGSRAGQNARARRRRMPLTISSLVQPLCPGPGRPGDALTSHRPPRGCRTLLDSAPNKKNLFCAATRDLSRPHRRTYGSGTFKCLLAKLKIKNAPRYPRGGVTKVSFGSPQNIPPARLGSARFGSARPGAARPGLAPPAWPDPARPGPGLTPPGSARPGPTAWPGSAWSDLELW